MKLSIKKNNTFKFIIVLAVTVLVFLGAFLTGTGSPFPPTTSCRVESDSLPEGTAFIEMLVKEKEIETYSTCNKEICQKYNISADAEIVTLNFDGFVSYTYHRYAPKSQSQISENNMTSLDNGKNAYLVVFGSDEEKFPEEFQELRFAYVDENGEVLKISDTIECSELLESGFIDITSEGVSIDNTLLKGSVVTIVFLLILAIETGVFLGLKTKKKKTK